jgi:hypothetical protein
MADVVSRRKDDMSEVYWLKCEKTLGRKRVASGRREDNEAQTIAVPTSVTDQFREPTV